MHIVFSDKNGGSSPGTGDAIVEPGLPKTEVGSNCKATKDGAYEILRHWISAPSLQSPTVAKFYPIKGDLERCCLTATSQSGFPLFSKSVEITGFGLANFARNILNRGAEMLTAHPELELHIPRHLAIPLPNHSYAIKEGSFRKNSLPVISKHLDIWGSLESSTEPPSLISDHSELIIGNIRIVRLEPRVLENRPRVSDPPDLKHDIFRIENVDPKESIIAPYSIWAEIAAHVAHDRMMPAMWRGALARLRTRPLDAFQGTKLVSGPLTLHPLNSESANGGKSVSPINTEGQLSFPARDPASIMLGRLRWHIGRIEEIAGHGTLKDDVLGGYMRALEGVLSLVKGKIPNDTPAIPDEGMDRIALTEWLSRQAELVRQKLDQYFKVRIEEIATADARLRSFAEQLVEREKALKGK